MTLETECKDAVPAHEDNTLLALDAERSRPQTVSQCHKVIDVLMKSVAWMQQQLADQQGQIAWLQERVEHDSRTSSRPSSSDVAASEGKRAQRCMSGCQRGSAG